MLLQGSPLSSRNLSKKPEQFFSLLGVTVEQFEQIFQVLDLITG